MKTIVCQGLYAPLTDDGTILVSGIAASCYVEVLPMLVPLSVQAWVAHSVLAPFRLGCFPMGRPTAEIYINRYSDRILPWLALASRLSTLPAFLTMLLLTFRSCWALPSWKGYSSIATTGESTCSSWGQPWGCGVCSRRLRSATSALALKT